MVGPGVGLAPLLSAVRSKVSPEMSLYFGCRFKDKDYLHGKELEDMANQGLIKFYPVFLETERILQIPNMFKMCSGNLEKRLPIF